MVEVSWFGLLNGFMDVNGVSEAVVFQNFMLMCSLKDRKYLQGPICDFKTRGGMLMIFTLDFILFIR